jgi:signal transduction histidine kinase/ligand-binding sensor domain-containing protein
MWFGTDSGLVKYDGRRVQRVAADGPASARVLALKLDTARTLWIGTDSGAARLIDGEVKPIPETQASAVTAIITPEAGRALMATAQGEIIDCSTSRDGSLVVHKLKPEDHPLLTIESRGRAPLPLTSLALIDDVLIVGTRSRGLLAINSSLAGAGAKPPDLVREVLSRPRAYFVEAIETDNNGRAWFGAETSGEDSGLFDGRDLMRPEKVGSGTGKVTALKFDERGDLWVGTDSRGVFVYRGGRKVDGFTFENTGGGLTSNHIYAVFIDREGVAWFGTDRGVSRYDPGSIRVEAISADPESNFSRVLFRSADGTVWCGTNRGLFVRDGDSRWHDVPELRGRVIHSILEGPGRLLVGTASGLFAAPSGSSLPNRATFTRIENLLGGADNIRAIETFRGALYIANFGRGIERLDGSTRTPVWPDERADPRARQVVSLHADDDRLWIGTAEAGVFLFDGNNADRVNALDEISGAMWSIDGSSKDVLWLATAGGLYAYSSGKLERVIDNVDARCVRSSGDDASGKSAWCATVGGGLYKVLLDPTPAGSRTRALISRIDAEQGLPSQSAFTVTRMPAGSNNEVLWVGTSRGVARYEPGRMAPVLNITRVRAKRVYSIDELSDGLNLEYPQNGLALEAAAISSRTFPEQFQYSLTVTDSEGRVVSEKHSRESQFLIEGLRPGGYQVSIRAFTVDLVPSEAGQFSFVVAGAPFPWTSAALSVLLALAIVAMWWGYRQNRRLARTNRQLADTRMQLANETESERRRIARDLHDQTLADLRGLMMLTDRLPASTNGHVPATRLREEIESISTEIRRICEDLSPSALANVGLAAALEWALADAVAHLPPEKKFEYEFSCDAGIEERLNLEPSAQIQVYRIVQEALSNVCRHSSASSVRLAIGIEAGGELVIQLEDNGCGFDAGTSGTVGRGLLNIRSRASLIEASVEWRARPGGGTAFEMRMAPEPPLQQTFRKR